METLGTAHKIDAENPTDIITMMPPAWFIERDDANDEHDDWEEN